MSAFTGLLGPDGETPRCRVITDTVSVHWYPSDASEGTPCLCGDVLKGPPEDDQWWDPEDEG